MCSSPIFRALRGGGGGPANDEFGEVSGVVRASDVALGTQTLEPPPPPFDSRFGRLRRITGVKIEAMCLPQALKAFPNPARTWDFQASPHTQCLFVRRVSCQQLGFGMRVVMDGQSGVMRASSKLVPSCSSVLGGWRGLVFIHLARKPLPLPLHPGRPVGTRCAWVAKGSRSPFNSLTFS